MLKTIFFLLCINFSIKTEKTSQVAEINFFDSINQPHMVHLDYYIKPNLTQYGVKFGVNLYKFTPQNCHVKIGSDTDEYFAAFVEIPRNCNPSDILKEIENHGADFIFIDIRDNENTEDLEYNKYDVPVFVVDNHSNRDPFMIYTAENEKRYINIFFRMKENYNTKSSFANIKLFYIPSYAYSSKFIDILHHVVHKLSYRIKFEPHIITFSSKSKEFLNNNCVGNGKYCAFDPDVNDSSITGKDVILEGLRQKCVFKAGVKYYFHYMRKFYKNCIHQINSECSNTIMSEVGVNTTTVNTCVNLSFHKISENNSLNENSILEEEKEVQKNSGLKNFPQIVINNLVYQGSLSQNDLLLSICASLHDETQTCRNIEIYNDDDFSVFNVVMTHFLLFLIGVVIMAVVCRWIAKRKYEKKLSKAIGKYVTEYSNMKEQEAMV